LVVWLLIENPDVPLLCYKYDSNWTLPGASKAVPQNLTTLKQQALNDSYITEVLGAGYSQVKDDKGIVTIKFTGDASAYYDYGAETDVSTTDDASGTTRRLAAKKKPKKLPQPPKSTLGFEFYYRQESNLAENIKLLKWIHLICFVFLLFGDILEAINYNFHYATLIRLLTIPSYLYVIMTTQDCINRINKLASLGCAMDDLGTSVNWFNIEIYIFFSNLLVLMIFLFAKRWTTWMDINP
jgi:hypothetical protein